MRKARKNNRVVRIPDEKTDDYKKLGYTITDMDGNVIYAPENKDAQIAALKNENAELRNKLAEYEAKAAAADPEAQDTADKPDNPPNGKGGKKT